MSTLQTGKDTNICERFIDGLNLIIKSFLLWSQSLIVIITSWFAIALDEIRTRRILREKADSGWADWKQSIISDAPDSVLLQRSDRWSQLWWWL